MSENLKTVLSEWRPLNGEMGERPSMDSDDPSEVENAALAALIRKMTDALAVVRDALTAAREAGLTGQSDAAEAKPLLDRLRKDGNSWAQPLLNEAADRIEELDCQLADANAHVAALTAALTTRRSACNEASERADEAERQLAEMRAALANCVSLVELKFGNTDDIANAAIEQARAAQAGRTRDLSHGLVYPRSPTTGNGDEP